CGSRDLGSRDLVIRLRKKLDVDGPLGGILEDDVDPVALLYGQFDHEYHGAPAGMPKVCSPRKEVSKSSPASRRAKPAKNWRPARRNRIRQTHKRLSSSSDLLTAFVREG
ncbi:MAG: hypothetical protein V3U30_00445, partial [Thermoplasmata archaeon]